MTDISISIINWNTKEVLKNCLASIYSSTKNLFFEVIVVDNNSSDGSVEMVRKEFPNAILIPNTENRGFAKANNQAYEKASGRYFLILNSDTIVKPEALETMVRFMDSHPEAAALGPRLIYGDGSLQSSCRTFPDLVTAFFQMSYLEKIFPENKVIGKYLMSYWNHDDLREVDQPMGACLMFRKKVLEQVGTLDERFFMYFEEVDLCYRLKKSGWKIYFIPDAQVVHLENKSSDMVWGKAHLYFFESMVKYFRKNHGVLKTFILKILILAGIFIRFFIWGIFLFTGKRKKIDIGRRYLTYFKLLAKLPFL